MARTYQEIQEQIEKLQTEAEAIRRKEIDGVIERIKEAISHYGLTPEDLGFTGSGGSQGRNRGPGKGRAAKKSAANGAPVGVKYRDDEGNTWGGRGPRPRWLRNALAAGKTLEDFRV